MASILAFYLSVGTLALAVEVPAVPTEIWRSGLGSWRKGEGGGGRGAPLIKPRGPHLAGGEKNFLRLLGHLCEAQGKRSCYALGSQLVVNVLKPLYAGRKRLDIFDIDVSTI